MDKFRNFFWKEVVASASTLAVFALIFAATGWLLGPEVGKWPRAVFSGPIVAVLALGGGEFLYRRLKWGEEGKDWETAFAVVGLAVMMGGCVFLPWWFVVVPLELFLLLMLDSWLRKAWERCESYEVWQKGPPEGNWWAEWIRVFFRDPVPRSLLIASISTAVLTILLVYGIL